MKKPHSNEVFTIVVSGSRRVSLDWEDWITKEIQSWTTDGVEIVVGDCPSGVDALVRRRFVGAKVFKADWSLYGNGAGPVRNRAMLDYALSKGGDVVLLAFPRKDSKGTRDCIDQAKSLGVEVYELTLP